MATTEEEQDLDTCRNKPSISDMAAHGNVQEYTRQPTNKELIELSLHLGPNNQKRLFIELFNDAKEIDNACFENHYVVDQNIDLFFSWKKKKGQGATVQHIVKAMDKVPDLDPLLREVFGRDRTEVIYKHEGGDRSPNDIQLNQLCPMIGKHQKALFIWLGLSPEAVEQCEAEHKGNVNNQIFAMFRQWRNQSTNPTINTIIDTMAVVKMGTGAAEKVFFSGRKQYSLINAVVLSKCNM